MMSRMRVLPVGRDAVLVEVASTSEAISLAAWAREQRLARDVVPGARTVLLDGGVPRDALAGRAQDGGGTRRSPRSVGDASRRRPA
jgi:hypothetical protein